MMLMLMQMMNKILEKMLLQSIRWIDDIWIIINRAIEGNPFRDKDLQRIFVSLLTMILGIDQFGFTSHIKMAMKLVGCMAKIATKRFECTLAPWGHEHYHKQIVY